MNRLNMFNRNRFKDCGKTNAKEIHNTTQKHTFTDFQFQQETGRNFQLKTGRITLLIVLVLLLVGESAAISYQSNDSKLELIPCKIWVPRSCFAHSYEVQVYEDFKYENERRTPLQTNKNWSFVIAQGTEVEKLVVYMPIVVLCFVILPIVAGIVVSVVILQKKQKDHRKEVSEIKLSIETALKCKSIVLIIFISITCLVILSYWFRRITLNNSVRQELNNGFIRNILYAVALPSQMITYIVVSGLNKSFDSSSNSTTMKLTSSRRNQDNIGSLETQASYVGLAAASQNDTEVHLKQISLHHRKNECRFVNTSTFSNLKDDSETHHPMNEVQNSSDIDWNGESSSIFEMVNGSDDYEESRYGNVFMVIQMCINCIYDQNFTSSDDQSSKQGSNFPGSFSMTLCFVVYLFITKINIGGGHIWQTEIGSQLAICEKGQQDRNFKNRYWQTSTDYSSDTITLDEIQIQQLDPIKGEFDTDIDFEKKTNENMPQVQEAIEDVEVIHLDKQSEEHIIVQLVSNYNFWQFSTLVLIVGHMNFEQHTYLATCYCTINKKQVQHWSNRRLLECSAGSKDKITGNSKQSENECESSAQFRLLQYGVQSQTPHEVDFNEDMNIVSLIMKQPVSYDIVQFLIEFCNLRKQNNMRTVRHFFIQEIQNVITNINDLKEIELSGEEVTDSLHRESQVDDYNLENSTVESLPAATASECLLKNIAIAVEHNHQFFPQFSLERHPYVSTVMSKISEKTDILSGKQKDRMSNDNTYFQPHLKLERRSAIRHTQVKLNADDNHGSCQNSHSAAQSPGQQFKDLKYKVVTSMSYKKENKDDKSYFKHNKYVNKLWPTPFNETGELIRRLTEIPQPQIDINYARKILEVFFVFEPLMNIVDQIALGRPPAPHVSMRYELLRFCTLRSYPKEDKPYIIKLAEAGFYYASDGDGVVCYCCGIRRYNWTADDQPMKIHKRINPTCKFLIKNEEVNVRNNYNGPFSKNLLAIDSIPEPVESQEPSEDVNNDWAHERTRSPAPRSENNESTGSSNQLGINTTVPKHSQYATKTQRLASFNGWPDTASHTPDVLADAGFFYAGFGDCVRCFYCGIGLRHWTQDDNPWIEHARWAKNCAFVKQKRGEEFVNLVQLAVQYSQDNASEENSGGNQLSPQEIENILLSDAAQSVIDMGYQPRIIKKAIEQIIRQNRQAKITAQFLMEKILEIEEGSNETPGTLVSPGAAASTVGATGTTEGATNSSLKQSPKESAEPKKKHKDGKPEGKKGTSTKEKKDKEIIITKSNIDVSKDKAAYDPSSQQDPKAIKAENEQLKEQTLCKICLDQTVSIVFLPCGHLVTCADCAPAMRKCPICRALVKGTVRTYMS